MRLSDAMVLGYSEIKHTNRKWLIPILDGTSCEGCAIGAALYAVGHRTGYVAGFNSMDEVIAHHWPWTAEIPDFATKITIMYEKVIKGEASFETVVDYVRSVEPAEAAPHAAEEKTIAESAPSLVAQG